MWQVDMSLPCFMPDLFDWKNCLRWWNLNGYPQYNCSVLYTHLVYRHGHTIAFCCKATVISDVNSANKANKSRSSFDLCGKESYQKKRHTERKLQGPLSLLACAECKSTACLGVTTISMSILVFLYQHCVTSHYVITETMMS